MTKMPRTATTISSALPDPPPALLACRQSWESDVPDVEALQTPLTRTMFGDVDIRHCVEKKICKSLINVEEKVVAFLVVMDHPNIPVLRHWTGWIRRYYRIDFASPWNTLFVHYFVWDPRYSRCFLPILKSLYKNNTKLEQVFMITPPKTFIFPELEGMFTPVYPIVESYVSSAFLHCQNLHLNLRHRIVNKLTVRKAGEEDNIDVQPLVSHQLEVLRYVYGDVRVGNVIDLKTPNKAVLVAEKGVSGVTVGVLSVSSKVDYNHVNFFYHHVLDTNRRDSTMERLPRTDTTKTDIRRGLPVTLDTFPVADELLSIELNMDMYQSLEEESIDDDEERDELVVYWDVDGDRYKVVDPVMEYLLRAKQRGSHTADLETEDNVQEESLNSHQSVDHTYKGRPSWSLSFLPEESAAMRERAATLSRENQQAYDSLENSIMVTLFALHPDLDTRYGFDMLEASFECFTDRHFCLMYLPTAYQGSPLTQHMVRMAPKLCWDFPHELYITHRNSIFSIFRVRPVTLVDYVSIYELVENISQGKKITKDIIRIILQEIPGSRGFVLECEGNIVGVAIINVNFRLQQLQPHYRIENLIELGLYDRENHGVIRHLVLCPIFLKSGPFFLRQIMHQSGVDTLSYFLPTDDIATTLHNDRSLITVLGDMTPVKPRRRIQYDLNSLDDFTPEDHVLSLDHNLSLFITTQKLLSVQKLELNYRVVVVGGSDTAMSFLENLIFRSARRHIKYNNLMLVSIHGFPWELRPHVAGDKMVPHSGIYTREYLSRINLSTHVNVLYGALTVINKKEKMICLNEDHWLRYDYLFLLTGMQFCKPGPELLASHVRRGSTGPTSSFQTDSDTDLKDDRDYPKQECRRNENIRELYSSAAQQHGENLFVINTPADAVIALGHLKKILKHKKEGKILIYGHGVNTNACVESLLVFGVPGHKIVLIISPHQNLSHSCLEANPFIDNAVLQAMETAGVIVHSSYWLVSWTLKLNSLEKVMFRNNDNVPLILDCIALFCYGSKSTNAKTYMAVNDAAIMYNNGIIIDNQFRTNDEYIYAAGPGTRYSNKHYPTQFAHHRYHNSVEIGLHLSKIFRRSVEPRTEDLKRRKKTPKTSTQTSVATVRSPYSENPDTRLRQSTLPELSEPVTRVAHLPGGWKYVKVSAPGRPLPLECQFNGQGDCGPILITGVPIHPDGPGYFQLSFSVYNTVREIVLFSQKEIPYQNLRELYGKHERLLNNLYEHYNQGQVSDLYAFFDLPWAYALYTSKFNEVARQCAEIFVSDESSGLSRVRDLDSEEFDVALGKLSVDHEAISYQYLNSSVPMYVEHLMLRFISQRSLQLPMYFTDSVLASWNQSANANSPLHRDPARVRQKPMHDS